MGPQPLFRWVIASMVAQLQLQLTVLQAQIGLLTTSGISGWVYEGQARNLASELGTVTNNGIGGGSLPHPMP